MERQQITKTNQSTDKRRMHPAAKPVITTRASAHLLLQLQRAVGNQAVLRMLQRSGDRGHGSCVGIQTKLKIGQPNDIYEQEADRMAEQVMRRPEPTTQQNPAIAEGYPSWRKEEVRGMIQMQEATPSAVKKPEADTPGTFLTSEERDKVIKAGENWIGTPYKYAGDSKDGIDCSHFVHRAYIDAGFNYTYLNTEAIPTSTNFVEKNEAQTADVVLFTRHAGLYNLNPPEKGKGILNAGSTGVHYGKSDWYKGIPRYYRYKKIAAEEGVKIQRKQITNTDVDPASADEMKLSTVKDRGHPLLESVRAFYEPRFGHDFSQVRVHTDTNAAESARALNALAYTVGRNVVFGAGQYATETPDGKRLLAHELAHVIQQSGGQTEGRPTVGSRALGYPIVSPVEASLLQRDVPPHMASPTPVAQRPYYRTDEAIADLRRAMEYVLHTPPDFNVAKAIIRSVYQWFSGFVTSGRARVAFLRSGNLPGAFDICLDARNAAGEMHAKLTMTQQEMQLRGEERLPSGLLDSELHRVEFARDYLREMEEAVSYEVAEARSLPDVPSRFANITRAQMHLLAWLQQHSGDITSAAARFNIDRRAVAGAIAWEATEQVKTGSLRAFGPGKPHAWEFKGRSAVEEVESLGYILPVPADSAERRRWLESSSTAARYVAAIMGAYADIADRFGLHIRNDPGVLTTVYQGWTPMEWGAHLVARAPTIVGGRWPRPVVANPMGVWVDEHIPYLEEAVGFTRAEEQASGEEPHWSTPAGTILHI